MGDFDRVSGISTVQSAVQIYTMKKTMEHQQTGVDSLKQMLQQIPDQGSGRKSSPPDLGRHIDVRL